MTVLGISSSGRPNRLVSQTIQTILQKIGCFEKEDLPPELKEQKEVLKQIHKVAELLNARLNKT
ncbi:MAG: hypothetical protein LBK43_08260 [Treponema sp.]|jgi:hypothetical protein|nr:hypothetical protein [Treponema sp.]